MIQKAFGGKSSLLSMVALEKVGIFMDLASGYHISGKVSWWLGISCRRRLVTGLGQATRFFFWLDKWVGNLPLALQFSLLFKCAKNSDTKGIDYYERMGDQVIWGPIFRRNLTEIEQEFIDLINTLQNVHLPEGGEDGRLWLALKDHSFSAASFFAAICRGDRGGCPWVDIWKVKAPPRVLAFGWLSLWE